MKLPEYYQSRFVEIWGENKRFLFVPMDQERTFWLSVKPGDHGDKGNPNTIKKDLLSDFSDFDPLIKELISNSENFIRNDLADLGGEARIWHKGRAVFIGDAIHATTPNLAQGACQAIEDAYTLSKCIKTYSPDLSKAFGIYQNLREDKAMFVVNTSWRLGEMAHSKNAFLRFLYLKLWQFIPARIFKQQEKKLNDLSYNEMIK
jgi:2-polyprenyl-6-methoxyphenol hydroxylase-like FAD-dependent oxidoreductase